MKCIDVGANTGYIWVTDRTWTAIDAMDNPDVLNMMSDAEIRARLLTLLAADKIFRRRVQNVGR